MIVMTSIDSKSNRFREYGMDIQPGLFGEWCLIRWWNRIGNKSQKLEQWFPSLQQAEDELLRVKKVRKSHGYSIVS